MSIFSRANELKILATKYRPCHNFRPEMHYINYIAISIETVFKLQKQLAAFLLLLLSAVVVVQVKKIKSVSDAKLSLT